MNGEKTDREASQPIIQLKGITRVFGEGESTVHALADIDLNVQIGEFVAVMGASGSGKSTCMNIIGCLDQPTSGRYLFSGIDVGKLDSDGLSLLRRYRIGFIFQGFNLLSRTSALENVEMPLIYQRVPRKDRRERALAALEKVGLVHRAHHAPNELSGGQQQRVAIARAIVTQPRLLVADEPTGNLDSVTGAEVMDLLLRLNVEQNITIVMVTHERKKADYASRRILFSDGRMIEDHCVAGGPDVR